MDAHSSCTQSHSCEAMNGACGFIHRLILLQPAPVLAAVKQGQVSAFSVLARLLVV
jgi:hypothetical protein